MRKVNLKPYDVPLTGQDGKQKSVPYSVVNSLASLLFSPAVQITGRDILRQGALAKQIEDAEDEGEVLLEEEEYNRLKQAVEAFKGYGRSEVELVRRVLEAEKVEVKPSKSK